MPHSVLQGRFRQCGNTPTKGRIRIMLMMLRRVIELEFGCGGSKLQTLDGIVDLKGGQRFGIAKIVDLNESRLGSNRTSDSIGMKGKISNGSV